MCVVCLHVQTRLYVTAGGGGVLYPIPDKWRCFPSNVFSSVKRTLQHQTPAMEGGARRWESHPHGHNTLRIASSKIYGPIAESDCIGQGLEVTGEHCHSV